MAVEENEVNVAADEKNPPIIKDFSGIMKGLLKLWWLFLSVGILSGAGGFFMYLCKNRIIEEELFLLFMMWGGVG